MCHFMSLGICNNFLQILLFLSYTRATFNFNETMCLELSAHSGCKCFYKDESFDISCSGVKIELYKSKEINEDYKITECHLLDINTNYPPPKMDIGSCDYVEINNSHLSGEPIAYLFNHLGIKDIKGIMFFHNSLEGSFNQLLSGFSGLEGLKLYSNGLTSLPTDLFIDLSNVTKLTIHERLLELPQHIFDHLKKLTILNLSDNALQKLPVGIFRNQHKLKELYINQNPLGNLSKAAFEGAKSLQVLDLSYNGIERFELDVFSLLPNLRKMDLSYNKLLELSSELNIDDINITILPKDGKTKHLQNIFGRLKKHTEPDLSNNALQQLPVGIRNQHKLKELDLSYNRLHTLSKTAFEGATSLQVLDLSYNGIEYFEPDVFSLLTNLSEVNLNKNDLRVLPPDLFANNKNLNILRIENNINLQLLPSTLLANLSHLHEIFVSVWCYARNSDKNFKFHSFDTRNEMLQNKRSLVYEGCNIGEIPGNFFTNSSKWRIISLSDNYLRSLPVTLFVDQYELDLVDLSYNMLKALHNDLFCGAVNLSKLDLAHNQLTELSDGIFTPLVKLEELYLSNNKLSLLPDELFRDTKNLVLLKLSYNQLTEISAKIFSPLLNLKVLYLDNNHLTTIGYDAQSFSFTLIQLTLADNPWDCDCATIPLMLFAKRQSIITDYKEMFCAIPKKITVINFLIGNNLCQDVQHVIISLTLGILGVSLLIAVTFALYYKWKTEIKIWMYKYPWLRRFVSEHEVDKRREYDAFVSYAHKDQQFVGTILVPALEQNGPIRFKLCVHVRDFIVGESISNQIACAINTSRRTIIVLSQHFINSVWACMEFRLALQAALNERRTRVIVIMYGDIDNIESLDPLMSAYLKTNTYLEWGDPWFWDRLRYAMPHSVIAPPVETFQATTAV